MNFNFNLIVKNFNRKVFIFILPIVVIAIGIEILLRQIPNEYTYKRDFIGKHGDSIETLILGPSHTYMGLNPKYFNSKAFNLAANSQPLKYDNELFHKFKKHLTNLKTVIIPVSYKTLTVGENELYADKIHIAPYHIYYNLDLVNKTALEYSYLLSFDRKSSFYKIFNYLTSDYDELILCDESGWNPSRTTNNRDDKFFEMTVKRKSKSDPLENFDIKKKALRQNKVYIEEIVTYCNLKNINVILLTTPVHKVLYKSKDDPKLKIVENTCLELVHAYKNCFFINELQDTRFTNIDFYDISHLNVDGATVLSKIVNKKIESLNKG